MKNFPSSFRILFSRCLPLSPLFQHHLLNFPFIRPKKWCQPFHIWTVGPIQLSSTSFHWWHTNLYCIPKLCCFILLLQPILFESIRQHFLCQCWQLKWTSLAGISQGYYYRAVSPGNVLTVYFVTESDWWCTGWPWTCDHHASASW